MKAVNKSDAPCAELPSTLKSVAQLELGTYTLLDGRLSLKACADLCKTWHFV